MQYKIPPDLGNSDRRYAVTDIFVVPATMEKFTATATVIFADIVGTDVGAAVGEFVGGEEISSIEGSKNDGESKKTAELMEEEGSSDSKAILRLD